MSILRILVASALGLMFIAGAVHNVRVLRRMIAGTLRYPSQVPLLPGLAGAIALAVLPFPSLHRYIWVPLVLDPGCLPYLILALSCLSAEMWRHSRINLVTRYVAKVGDRRTVTISLYRKDFVICQEIRRPPGEYGISELSRVGDWCETPDELILHIGQHRIVLKKEGSVLHQTQGHSGYEQDPDLSLAGLVFERVT
jgi:hypothetical protein